MTIKTGISQSNVEKYDILAFVYFFKGPFGESKLTFEKNNQMKHFYLLQIQF